MKKGQGKYFVIGIVALVAIVFISSYNKLVTLDEQVNVKYNTINIMLEERYDKIPDLMETVKGMAKHEKEIVQAVADSRQMFANAQDANEKVEASNKLESNLQTLMNVTIENYPEIAATDMFKSFMDEYNSTQNKITNAKLDYDQIAGQFNGRIRRFPTSITANLAGLDSRVLYKVAEGSDQKPEINFTD